VDRVDEHRVPVFLVAVPPTCEPADVSVGLAGEGEAHGGEVSRRDLAPAEDDQDQSPADATVSILERVDRLELSVCDRCLDHRRDISAIAEGAQVIEQLGNELVRRGDELGVSRARGRTANPVLLFAAQASEVLVTRTCEQHTMDLEQMFGLKLVDFGCQSDGALECADVRENALSRQVAGVRREGSFREATVREHEPLDPR